MLYLTEIGQLSNLEVLNLSFNKLKGDLPESIATMQNLLSLQLFLNQFEGEIPEWIGSLANLEVFSFI